MKELDRVTFSPDTTSGGGSSRVSLRGPPKKERENLFKFNKTTERTRSKKNKTHVYDKSTRIKNIEKD